MKRNNNKTVEKLFKSDARRMYNICFRMMGNKQDAEDVLQDAYYKAYVNFDKLESIERFSAWLRKIVVNQCIAFHRQHIYFADIDLDNKDLLDEAEDNWMHNVSMKVINNAIQKLPDGARIIFNLYLLENYSHKQIADMLEISQSTSKSQYYRAKQLLREQLMGVKLNG